MNNIESEKVIKDISQNLLVYIREDGNLLPIYGGGIDSKSNHEPLFNKYVIGSGLLNGSFDTNVPMINNLMEIAKNNQFLMFCNASSSKNKLIIIYASEQLTSIQRNIAKYCMECFKKFGVSVVLGVFNHEGNICKYSPDEFVKMIENEKSVPVR